MILNVQPPYKPPFKGAGSVLNNHSLFGKKAKSPPTGFWVRSSAL